MKYAVLFEKTDTGYSARVADLPGCVAMGATLEETAELMQKAIQMHVAGMRERGEPIPEPRSIAEYITKAFKPRLDSILRVLRLLLHRAE